VVLISYQGKEILSPSLKRQINRVPKVSNPEKVSVLNPPHLTRATTSMLLFCILTLSW